jgi:antitoxin HicB
MKYHFKVHKEKGGYWAEGVEISWANTQAETMKELYLNMKEVLELCLEEPDDRSTFIPPLPQAKVKGKNVVEVEPDPQVALAAMVRRERLLGKMTQRQAMLRMGFKNLIQYQRLESAKTANAELSTLAKVKKAFPAFSLDLVLG